MSQGGVRQIRFTRPSGATDVFLVRHGESAAAHPDRPFTLVDGHGDPELHEVGRAQALRVADRLMHADLDALYVTGLRRTAETAAPLASRTGLTPFIEPDLREVRLGEWEGGLFRTMVAEGHPIALRMAAEERWDVIPGAEPAAEFGGRVRRGLLTIAARHPDQSVAVFTHGGVIGWILATATGARPFAFNGADNASISHLVVHGDQWTLRRFNDTAHLDLRFSEAPQPPT